MHAEMYGMEGSNEAAQDAHSGPGIAPPLARPAQHAACLARCATQHQTAGGRRRGKRESFHCHAKRHLFGNDHA
jgi:hypothetical protein